MTDAARRIQHLETYAALCRQALAGPLGELERREVRAQLRRANAELSVLRENDA